LFTSGDRRIVVSLKSVRRSVRAATLRRQATPRSRGTPNPRRSRSRSRLRGRGGSLHNFRAKHWRPALRAAGFDYRTPYALRHTFATFAIAAKVPLFELARFMGTSVGQIEATYGHLLPDAHDRTRAALDAFGNNAAEAAEGK
jgi:integrase